MKKFAGLIVILCQMAGFNAGAVLGQTLSLPIEKQLTVAELENHSIDELCLMRNSIFAKYGRPFLTYEIHAYFMQQSWYKPDENFDAKKLSATDLKNIDLISARENAMRKNDIIESGGRSQINVQNVYNLFQYPAFSSGEQKKLSQNGFIVLPTRQNQLFHLYENNDYLGIPSFITVDAVLQLYHLYFDMTLRNLESKFLTEKLKILCRRLLEETDTRYRTESNPDLKAALAANLVYFSIPSFFLHGELFPLPEPLKTQAMAEINHCQNHAGWDDSPLLQRKFDYSQFIPRGHYTRSDALKNYFLAMMWLGNAGIDFAQAQTALQSVLTTHLLHEATWQGKPLLQLWQDIYEPTVFYVGLSDDTGPDDLKKIMDGLFGPQPAITDYAKPDLLKQIPQKLSNAKISGHGEWGHQGKQFRFMGQRFVPDSYIFQRLTRIDRSKNLIRKKPMGLDVPAAFGNQRAKELMLTTYRSSWEQFPPYPKILDSLIAENARLSAADWTQNLYYNWLYSLLALFDLKESRPLPFFMKTAGWEHKTLNTWLASWAELRHNTILYAKQSIAAECGGGGEQVKVWIPEPPKGYVEPNTVFYERLIALLKSTRTELEKREMIDSRMASLAGQFTDLLEFLNRIARKELNREKITLQEYEQIQKTGALLDNLTLSVLVDEYAGWDQIDGPDKNMPVIADVHTADDEALEVGVGKAHEIFVIVDIDGKLKLTRGAIFSYYEFWQPISQRLTDEAWQNKLELSAPPQPDWTEIYKSDAVLPKKLRPTYVPPGDIPKSSTEPGWKIMYYDTGC